MSDQVKITIIGASYAGIMTTKALLKAVPKSFITVIERKDHMHHHIASPRGLVDPKLGESLWIPLDKLLTETRGKVVQGTVTVVNEKDVVLENGTVVAHDYLVYCAGCRHHTPARPSWEAITKAAGLAELDHHQKAIAAAEKVLIIGGGPVGVEVAGEIKTAYPDKTVTLITSTPTLIPGPLSDKFKARALTGLQAIGVTVHFKETIDITSIFGETTFSTTKRTIVLPKSGISIESDVQYLSTGIGKYNGELLKSLGADILNEKNEVKVDKHLQVPGHPHIFALGDVAATGGSKLSVSLMGQAPVVAKNIATAIKEIGRAHV